MKILRTFYRAWLIPALACAFFFCAGLALIPWPGWQNDELFFAGPIYDRNAAYYYAHIGSIRIPVMVASYTGALKTWLYMLIFRLVPPSSWSIRVPMLLAGVVTLWLTWKWMIGAGAGRLATSITVVLLATDASFLLTTTFDWGPVAIQHVFLMAGLVAFQAWIARPSPLLCGLAFLLWGAGVWDKALMLWPLSGLAIAAAVVYPREALRRVTAANVAIAAAAFVLGAAPFVWFNIDKPAGAFDGNVNLSHEDLRAKLRAVRGSADGSSLFDYIAYRDGAGGHRPVQSGMRTIPLAIRQRLGSHERNWMPFGFALAAILAFLTRDAHKRRLMLCLAIASATGWLEMFLNQGTGTFVHHVILLWPLPVAFVGLAFASIMDRAPGAYPAVMVAVALLTAGNVLNINEYFADLIANGGAKGWTDAVYELSASINASSPSWIGLLDWGCLNDLRVLRGTGDGLFEVGSAPKTGEEVLQMKSIPGLVLVTHVRDKQIAPAINEAFHNALASQGLTEHVIKTIPDREGRPVFELLTLQGS